MRSQLVSYGRNALEYVTRKAGSARRQIAYYAIPADIRAGHTSSKIKKHSFSLAEVNKRADQYEGYLLRDRKIVKTVNYFKGKIAKANESFNSLSIVKSAKEITTKTGNFLVKWFGG